MNIEQVREYTLSLAGVTEEHQSSPKPSAKSIFVSENIAKK